MWVLEPFSHIAEMTVLNAGQVSVTRIHRDGGSYLNHEILAAEDAWTSLFQNTHAITWVAECVHQYLGVLVIDV